THRIRRLLRHGYDTKSGNGLCGRKQMKARITQKIIEKLEPPPRGNRIVYDLEIPGFGVRITAGKAIAFTLEYSLHGRQRRFTIGSWPTFTATAARARALEVRSGVARGIDPLAEKERAREAPTIKELADRYLHEHAIPHKRASSLRDDRSMIKAIIVPELG